MKHSREKLSLQAGLSLFVLGLATVLSLAQGDKVTVVGTVTDGTGAVVPGTDVSLIRVARNEILTAVTSDTGDFVFTGVVPGVYDFEVSLTGFKSYRRAGQKLDVGQTYRMDAQLEVGEVSETVEVRAATSILKTEGPELGQVIHNEKVDALPLNDRDVFGAFGALVPGVQPSRDNITGGGLSFNVKGQRYSDNLAMIDGSLVSETNSAVQILVNPDAVQEFEVKTGLYGAEYGIKPGGQFSLVTKSGTNDLHGTLFGSSGKWGGGTWFGAFRIPNLLRRLLVNTVGCSGRGRRNCGKLRATSNGAGKPVIRSFPSAVRTVEKQLRALAISPPELVVFPRFT